MTSTFVAPVPAAASEEGTETVVVVDSASFQGLSVSTAGTQPLRVMVFAPSPSTPGQKGTEQIIVNVAVQAGYPFPERVGGEEDQLTWDELLADLERELGHPISDDVRAEVEREWRD